MVRITDDSINPNARDRPGRDRAESIEYSEKVRLAIEKVGGQYLGQQKAMYYSTYHYWSFDVVPGNGELAPAVKSFLTNLYHNTYKNQVGDTSLYAVWTGQ